VTRGAVARAVGACAAAVLLTACSGDDADDAAPSSVPSVPPSSTPSGPVSTATSATSTSEAPQAGSEFCDRTRELLDGLGAAFSDEADAASVEDAFRQTADGFRAVEPPAAVADDWLTLADGLDDFAGAVAELDESDPASVAAFQERTASLQGELTAAANGVESYLVEQCGTDPGRPGPSATAGGGAASGS
jgi:hypothetical protein